MSEAGGLREAVEALADEFDSNVDWSAGRNNYGDNEAWESAARQVRALLAAHPAPEADPTAGEREAQVVLGQIGEHAEYEPVPCSECGKSPSACGRSPQFCCSACSGSKFGTHDPATPDAGDASDDYGPPGTASRWCHVHDSPAAECWSDACLASTSAGEGLTTEARQRENRIALWKAEALDPERDEELTPLAALLASLEADCRAAGEAAAAKAAGERALLDAAEDARDYLTTPNVSLRDWLRERAARIALEVTQT